MDEGNNPGTTATEALERAQRAGEPLGFTGDRSLGNNPDVAKAAASDDGLVTDVGTDEQIEKATMSDEDQHEILDMWIDLVGAMSEAKDAGFNVELTLGASTVFRAASKDLANANISVE